MLLFDLGSAVGYLLLDTSGFKKELGNAQNQLNTFFDKSSTAGQKFDALGKTMQSVGGTMTKYVTAPLIGAGTSFVAFASEADAAFSKFKSSVGDVTGDVERYRDVMESIYKNKYGESFEDIADSMATVKKYLGELDPTNMQKTTESALALRDTIGYDVQESIRTVDTLMKNFGLSAEEAFDYIVKGNQEGLDYSGEFLDTINEYSVQFKKVGFDAQDMFAILKEGADSGAWNLDKIGDAIKEFSIRAVDGSNTTIEGFEALGFSADSMAAKFAAGGDSAKEAFNEVIKALSDMDDPVQQSIAGVNLFGTMWEDLGPDVVTQLANIESGAVEMKGSMDKLKEVRYDNLQSAVEGLGRSLKSAGADLGEYLIPYVEKAIEIVNGLVDKFHALDEPTKEMIVNIGLVAAALGPALLVGGKVVSGISSIVSLVTTLSPAIAALTGPIGLVVAALAAFALAWATDFGGIRETVESVIGSVQQILTAFYENHKTEIQVFLDVVSATWDLICGVIELAFDTISGLFDVFAKAFSGDWEGVWESAKNLFETVWNGITNLLANFLDNIIDALIIWAVNLYNESKETFNRIMDAFNEVWEDIMDWFRRALEDPVGAILDIGSSLYDAGRNIFNSLWDGLESVWNSISDWVSDCVDWIVDKVKFWQDESAKVNRDGEFGSKSSGSFASGLDYVPRTMNVTVHEGERILTKEENKAYGKGSYARLQMNVTFTQPVDSNTAKKVSRDLARETEKELRGKGVVLV